MNKLQTENLVKTVRRVLLLVFCVAAMSGALYAQPKAVGKSPAAKTGDARVAKALNQMKTEYEVEADGQYKITFGVGKDRSHTAYVVSETDTAYNLEMRGVYALAAISDKPFAAELISELLQENMQSVTSWALLKVKDGFAIVNITHVPADADGKRLDAAIQSVLVSADALEQRLSKEDKL